MQTSMVRLKPDYGQKNLQIMSHPLKAEHNFILTLDTIRDCPVCRNNRELNTRCTNKG